MLVYGGLHSVLAALRTKALARHWVGAIADRWYRALFNVFAFVSLLPVLALPALLPDVEWYRIPAPWVYATMVVQGAAGIMLAITVVQTDALTFVGLRQLLQGTGRSRPENLVVTGFYRWMRHPLYTGSLVFLWLTPVMTRNLAALYLGFTAYFILGAVLEERKLLKLFGEAYAEYQTQTPMFFPSVRALLKAISK